MTFAEREEVVALRRRLRQKEEEVEILGKALAFFARKTDH
jgi:transposase-like protein